MNTKSPKASKVACLIKAYLLLKRCPCTSKEITEFINNHRFGIKDGVSTYEVATLIQSHQNQGKLILSDVMKVSGHPNKYTIKRGSGI